MKKGLIFGLTAVGIAAAAALIYKSVKNSKCCCEDDLDENYDGCCGCDDECCDEYEICDIPAEKAEDTGVTADACACGCEEEELDKVEDVVESDEV
ncbi:MAG: hypothetical protein MR503_06340 [Oscillospiraceae bacterium]|nr:hypothetical protein [Oscillospiraceae bacterium]